MNALAAQRHFARLDLPLEADARDIRRAYARELKKIDQASDSDGFQQLRSAYEAALRFAERRDPADDTEAVAPPDRPLQAPAPVDVNEEAVTVVEAFCETMASLAARRGGASHAACQQALRDALADERLVNIAARQSFEAWVAILLARGWRPGHEALLGAAETVFGWSGPAHLAGLGRAGAVLERAFVERAMFDNQAMLDQQPQRRILALLRQEPAPDDAEVTPHLRYFARMLTRFPHWLPIVAPAQRIADWQARIPAGPALSPRPGFLWWAARILLGMLAIMAVMKCNELVKTPAWSPPPASNPRLLAVRGAPITQDRLDDINARVDYRIEGDLANLPLAAEFDVFLAPDGRVTGANLVTPSGLPKLDAAIRASIMASKPFPSETARIVVVVFKYAPPIPVKPGKP